VAAAAGGDFAVSWLSYEQDGYHSGVFAQRFASSGARFGTELQVNTHTAGTEGFPGIDVAAADNGDFLVVWESEDSQDGSGFGVFGKLSNSSAGEASPAGKRSIRAEISSSTTATRSRQSSPTDAPPAAGKLRGRRAPPSESSGRDVSERRGTSPPAHGSIP